MKIGFDAKRAFHNATGLGNYSRALIHDLAMYFPEHSYFAFNPKKTIRYPLPHPDVIEINPVDWLDKKLPAYWRSFSINKDIPKNQIDLYHGLSHELPWGIEKLGIKTIVSIHDLIVWRYPNQYSKFDVWMHRKKIRHACKIADHIIAISQQTKNDLIEFLNIPPEKISICYQPCHPRFEKIIDTIEINSIKQKLNLPEKYFLYVGSINERKNLLKIVEAMYLESASINIPLVVVGRGKVYKQKVMDYIADKKMNERIIFLSDLPNAQCNEFRDGHWLPAIYQASSALIYPSMFEGFGIPILEALWSNTPVITSNLSSLPEVGGSSSLYIDPNDTASIAQAMLRIIHEPELVQHMKENGRRQALAFSREKCTRTLFSVYDKCTKKPA